MFGLGPPMPQSTPGGPALQLIGQDPQTAATLAAITRLDVAIRACDVEAVLAELSEACVLEPADAFAGGPRIEGRAAAREYWTRFFASTPDVHYELEEIVVGRDRAVVRWRLGDSRGVDVMRVLGGKVAERLSYLKG
jgi:hypothetical protein